MSCGAAPTQDSCVRLHLPNNVLEGSYGESEALRVKQTMNKQATWCMHLEPGRYRPLCGPGVCLRGLWPSPQSVDARDGVVPGAQVAVGRVRRSLRCFGRQSSISG